MISLLMLLYTLVSWIAGHAVLGWTSPLASIWLIGGIQLLSLGVIGEYTGKIYNESKGAPRALSSTGISTTGAMTPWWTGAEWTRQRNMPRGRTNPRGIPCPEIYFFFVVALCGTISPTPLST